MLIVEDLIVLRLVSTNLLYSFDFNIVFSVVFLWENIEILYKTLFIKYGEMHNL
jgi:hypothetical protein